jgi:hypothetical protein
MIKLLNENEWNMLTDLLDKMVAIEAPWQKKAAVFVEQLQQRGAYTAFSELCTWLDEIDDSEEEDFEDEDGDLEDDLEDDEIEATDDDEDYT